MPFLLFSATPCPHFTTLQFSRPASIERGSNQEWVDIIRKSWNTSIKAESFVFVITSHNPKHGLHLNNNAIIMYVAFPNHPPRSTNCPSLVDIKICGFHSVVTTIDNLVIDAATTECAITLHQCWFASNNINEHFLHVSQHLVAHMIPSPR